MSATIDSKISELLAGDNQKDRTSCIHLIDTMSMQEYFIAMYLHFPCKDAQHIRLPLLVEVDDIELFYGMSDILASCNSQLTFISTDLRIIRLEIPMSFELVLLLAEIPGVLSINLDDAVNLHKGSV